jgi:hypothetical protein
MRLAFVQAATYLGVVPIGLSGALHAVLFTIGFDFSWHGVWHPLAGALAPTTARATACAVIQHGDQNSPLCEISTRSAVLILFPHALRLLAPRPLILYDSHRLGPLLLILQIRSTRAPVFLLPSGHRCLARLLFDLHRWNDFQQEAKPTIRHRCRLCSPQWFLLVEIW